jgi:5-methyltetrahydropteroyltriglutamate--homocysteine methyltransferase
MTKSAVLGYPRIGAMRELKKSLEAFWKGAITKEELDKQAQTIRLNNWNKMKEANIDFIPSNDFSYYDQILDLSCLLGNIPARYNFSGESIDSNTYFLMARGKSLNASIANQAAQEMTKWFDTNYHYMVPEFSENTNFSIKSSKIFDDYNEAKALGIQTRPVLVGPVTYLSIGKDYSTVKNFNKFSLLDNLLKTYKDILTKLSKSGAEWVQIDEPIASLELNNEQKNALKQAYNYFSQEVPQIKIMFTTYFDAMKENSDLIANLPVSGLHIDATKSNESELVRIAKILPKDTLLSVGIVNGRNIWINNYETSLNTIQKAKDIVGEDRLIIASSCSLLHSPVSLKPEEKLNPEIKQWLSFAEEKLTEINDLVRLSNNENKEALTKNQAKIQNRQSSKIIHNEAVQNRLSKISDKDFNRQSGFSQRINIQATELKLPALPTTTIGSFPQTNEVRQARAKFKSGELTAAQYEQFLKEETKACIDKQHDLDIDVLVHGEFERNDMVEYFGEQLDGFCFTQFGWVQSYGSRCVKPPVIFGDISRPKAMTVNWSTYAQSLTKKPMKGMLTGPVTILKWSFVRDDQPWKDTAYQIALAIRDEVQDLEAAGIKIIQIDEAAFKEAQPLRKSDWNSYLEWAVNAFRLCSSGVKDKTQIHTHMCYSEFNEIIESIANMDADVISIETSRSKMELLDAFVKFNYPNDIGPGVYDIHSPAIPSKESILTLVEKAKAVIPVERLWINPDCGLKTRQWEEVLPALQHMVDAAKESRIKVLETV